jgi:hypothetical protein
MLNHTTIDVALLATVNLLRGSRPNDRSAADRHYAVTITMLEQAYAYFNTYVTRGTVAVANDLARKTLELPADCDALPPTFQERHDANVATLQELHDMVWGDTK